MTPSSRQCQSPSNPSSPPHTSLPSGQPSTVPNSYHISGSETDTLSPTGLFIVYGRPNDNKKSKIIIAPVPGVPNDYLYRSLSAAVGPKIYIGGQTFGHSSTDVRILACRFHTWECSLSMPTVEKGVLTTTVLDGKIYVIGMWTEEDSWVDVFDAVAGRWEAIPSPKLRAYGKEVVGCDIRGGKVCVWMAEEELRFDPRRRRGRCLRVILD